MEVLQHLWATQSSVWPSSWYVFSFFSRIWNLLSCNWCLWLLCHHGTLMRRSWIHFPVLSCSQVVVSSNKVSFSLSWKYPALSASSCGSCSPPPDCFGGLLIDSVPCVNIVLLLREPQTSDSTEMMCYERSFPWPSHKYSSRHCWPP